MEVKETYVHETCGFCNGSGKVIKYKKVKKKCKDCSDRGHGCFGSARKDGYGHSWCSNSVPVLKKKD